MNDKQNIDSILFDLDGTLWDGVGCYAEGFNDFFKSKNIKKRFTKDDLYGFMGLEEDIYLEYTLPEFKYEERKRMYRQIIDLQYKHIQNSKGKIYQDVKEDLKLLSRKYQLFIVSNCAKFTIDYFMEWAGIQNYITDTMAHGMNFKPKHENLSYLVKKHALKHPIYVGDTHSDRKQSEKADIPFAFVSYGFGQTDKYHLKFDSFSELTDYFIKKANSN